ncbi:MAG: histone deacetylase [Deltaproteobacteria bacterium]|nr:histone deacetylase [Deltaproteobacteria bacterium]
MTTLLVSDPVFMQHDPGPGHPESVYRLARIDERLQQAPISGVALATARAATDEELLRVHSAAHVEALRALDGQDVAIDADTFLSQGSHGAARAAAGGAVEAVHKVWRREATNAFVLCRPPGHHAEREQAMGFCVFNNVAVAAEAALAEGAKRVLILDWDVHHGNGTQHTFEARDDVMFMSAHQYPMYPGTGALTDVGKGAGRGFTVNCAMPPGQTDADYGAVFERLFLPVAEAYAPDMILVSAGFDAHAADPLGGMRVTERGFAAMTTAVMELADRVAHGRVVLLLEGGYNLTALANSVHACTQVLTGARRESFPDGSERAAPAVAGARQALAFAWPGL